MRWNWRKAVSTALVCVLCFGMTAVHASDGGAVEAGKKTDMETEAEYGLTEEGQVGVEEGTEESDTKADMEETTTDTEEKEGDKEVEEKNEGEITEETGSAWDITEEAGEENGPAEEGGTEGDCAEEAVEEPAGEDGSLDEDIGESAGGDIELAAGADLTQEETGIMAAGMFEEPEEQDEEGGIMYADSRSSIGISDASPGIGQINSYECTNGVQVWTAPASGRYRISCYGGAGGDQNIPGDTLPGGRGSIRQGTIRLEKGTVLYIHAGGNGRSGNRQSHGSPEGNDGGYNGGASSGYDTSDLGNNGRYWTHGSGGGASDVRLGGNGLDNQIMVAGGGGGADKKTDGSNGDSGRYNGRRLGGSEEGGGGGYYGGSAHNGGSSYINTAYFTDISENNGGSTSGQVTIQVVSLFPQIRLTASEGWSGSEVTIRASVLQSGEGIPGAYLSWERDENGTDIWTAENTHAVSKNGTYTCKIRDNAGNVTEQSITISNIDCLAPVIKELTASDEKWKWTNGDVVLTVLAEDAAGTAEYSSSGLPAEAYLWGMLDESGNIIWGYGGRAEEDGSGTEEGEQPDTDPEQPDGTEEEKPEAAAVWSSSCTFTVSGNGIYVCRIRDNAGNVTEMSYEVANIDRLLPEAKLILSTEEWTNEDITITADGDDREAEGCDGRSGIQDFGYAWGEVDASGNTKWLPPAGVPDEVGEGSVDGNGEENGGTEKTEETDKAEDETGKEETEGETWPVWSGEDTCVISHNGTYICLIRDNAGNEIQLARKVTNMDRLLPDVILTADTVEKTRRVILTVAAEDREATGEYGMSGIKDYCWEMQGNGADDWTEKNTYIAEKNGTYICRIRDHAGNTASVMQTITNVDESPAGGSGSGSTLPSNPLQPTAPDQITEPDKIMGPDTASLLENLKRIFEHDDMQEADKGSLSLDQSGKEKNGADRNEKNGQLTDGRRDGHMPKYGDGKPDSGGKGGRRDGNGHCRFPFSFASPYGTAAVAAGILGGMFLLLFLLFFVLLYMTRSADIYLLRGDGRTVFRGRRRIIKRRDAFYLYIDLCLYDEVDTAGIEIRPCRWFVRENRGSCMRVCLESREADMPVDDKIRLKMGGAE